MSILDYYSQKHTGKRELSILLAVFELWLIHRWANGSATAGDAAQYLGSTCVFPFLFYAFGLDFAKKAGAGDFIINLASAIRGNKKGPTDGGQ